MVHDHSIIACGNLSVVGKASGEFHLAHAMPLSSVFVMASLATA